MTDAKHSPGPWGLYRRTDGERVFTEIVSRDGGFMIAEVRGATEIDGKEHGENSANARLLVAAPELLNGCNALLGLLDLLCNRDDIDEAIYTAIKENHRVAEAKAAVAKATGAA